VCGGKSDEAGLVFTVKLMAIESPPGVGKKRCEHSTLLAGSSKWELTDEVRAARHSLLVLEGAASGCANDLFVGAQIVGGDAQDFPGGPALLERGAVPAQIGRAGATVLERVGGAAQLPRSSLGAGGAFPRLPAASERALLCPPLGRPAFGPVLAGFSPGRFGGFTSVQVAGHAWEFPLSIVCFRVLNFFSKPLIQRNLCRNRGLTVGTGTGAAATEENR
jgi:hypothetical protein